MVHQVARRQRHADRAFAKALCVRRDDSAPDFMSPNGNAAASSRPREDPRGRGGYPSRLNGQTNLAVYDRATPKLRVANVGPLIAVPDLPTVLDELSVALL